LSKLLEIRTAAANFCSIAASFGKEEGKNSNYILKILSNTKPYNYDTIKFCIQFTDVLKLAVWAVNKLICIGMKQIRRLGI
jgi:hypothetical protein